MVVAFRRHTLLPLDDCLYALQPTIPHLTRSSLHRCLPSVAVESRGCHRSKAKLRPSASSKLTRSDISISTSPRFEPLRESSISSSRSIGPRSSPSSNCIEKVTRRAAADFLRRLIEAVPYRVHTVLTDNGTHFTDPTGDAWSPAEIREMIGNRKPFSPMPSNTPAPSMISIIG